MWAEIDQFCMLIKHEPDVVDLESVRSLLRRAQARIQDLETLLADSVVAGPAVLRLLNEIED